MLNTSHMADLLLVCLHYVCMGNSVKKTIALDTCYTVENKQNPYNLQLVRDSRLIDFGKVTAMIKNFIVCYKTVSDT